MKLNHLLIVTILLTALRLSGQAKFDKVKYAKGLTYMPSDSSFKLKFGLRMQNLLVVDFPENGPTNSTFMVRRFRLKFDGWLLSPKLVYKMEIGQSNLDVGGGSNLLLDAVLKYNATGNLWLWFGQTKLPGNRERVVSSQKLELVDRSLVNSFYNIDRDMGVQVHHHFQIGNMLIREVASISTGEGRNYTSANLGGYCYTGRLEFLPFGKFTSKGDYFLADLKHEKTPKLAIGLTYDLNDLAARSSGQRGSFNEFNRSLTSYMADMILKYNGVSWFTEVILKQADDANGDREKAIDPTIEGYFNTGLGFNSQLGYTTKDGWGVVGRFTSINPDKDIILAGDYKRNNMQQYTLGFSKFIVGHKLKVITDFSYNNYFNALPNSTSWRFVVELGI
ncbi:MAG: porin [Salibacteraceae bacterium]